MTNSKRSRLQRQKSESLQARATALIPSHRDSIESPSYVEIAPRAVDGKAKGAAPALSSNMTANQNNAESSSTGRNPSHSESKNPCSRLPEQTDDWMTVFCVEPPGGDARACCLGMWVPSALYGKVNWRLNQKAGGKDTDDWHSSDGCNGPCWAYVAFQIVKLQCTSLLTIALSPIG
jgi:hypothetical protein